MSYDYRVVSVDRVVDGDTLDATIDVGFRMTTQQRLRILGIDTPERGQPGWAEAGEFVRRWCIERAGKIRVETTKSDSFGRYLGSLYTFDNIENKRETLDQALLDAGLAVPYQR